MRKTGSSAGVIFRGGMYSGPFLRHPGLLLPGMALVLGARYSTHVFGQMVAAAPTHNDRLPGLGLSEPDRAIHIRALACLFPLVEGLWVTILV